MHNIIFVDNQFIINQVINICHNNQISREYSEEPLCNTSIMDYGNFAMFVLLEEIMLLTKTVGAEFLRIPNVFRIFQW